MVTENQAYRMDLADGGDCRSCEAPLLAEERRAGRTRCGVCGRLRALAKGRQRGYGPRKLAALQGEVDRAIEHRARVLGGDDGAGDRAAVRAQRRLGPPAR